MLAYVAMYEQNIHLVHILFLSVSNAACVMVVTEQVLYVPFDMLLQNFSEPVYSIWWSQMRLIWLQGINYVFLL